MNLENSHYDAFISYRHSDVDKFVADHLHRELEGLKLPRKLIKEGKGNGKRKIARVFRDQEELPLTNDLAEPITNALKNSEYLIVICSPRLPESIWCRREVETFIELHGRERVFAVLVEGRAHESFPDSILWAEQVVRDQSGFIRIERNPVEPLAADVRGKNKKEIRKKIKSEVLRLAAPMFDVSYDDLKQRHKEQKIKRMMTFSLAASAVFLAFAAISTTMAMMIRNQSRQIQSQAEELQIQYDAAMKNQANLVAAEAEQMIIEGNRKEAVEKLLPVMPASLDDTEQIPYTAATENALGEALHIYDMGNQMKATALLQMDTDAVYVEISPEEDKVMSIDDRANIYIWDCGTGTCLQKLASDMDTEEAPSVGTQEAYFTDNSHIVYRGKSTFISYNIDTQNIDVVYEEEGEETHYYDCVYVKEGNLLILDNIMSYTVFDAATGTKLSTLPTEYLSATSHVGYAEAQEMLICTARGERYDLNSNIKVFMIDTNTWELAGEYEIPYGSIDDMKIIGDRIFFIAMENRGDQDFYQADQYLFAMNIQDGEIIWTKRAEWGFADKIYGTEAWDSNLIGVDCNGTFLTLHGETGETNGVMNTGETMAACEPVESLDGTFRLISENGEVYDYLSTLQTYRTSSRIKMSDARIKQISRMSGVIATISTDNPSVTLYQFARGKNTEFVQEYEQNISQMEMNAAQDRILLGTYDDGTCHYYLYEADTLNLIKEITVDGEYGTECFFADEESGLFGILSDKVYFYSAKDGSEQGSRELLDENGEMIDGGRISLHRDTEWKNISFIQNQKLYIYDAATLELHYVTGENATLLEDELSNDSVFDLSDGMQYLAFNAENRQQVEIYNLEDNSLYCSIPVNTSYVRAIYFDESSERIYISDKDGTLSIYQIPDGTLLCTQELDMLTARANVKADGADIVIYGAAGVIVLDSNFEVKTTATDCVLYDESNHMFYSSWYQYLCRIPEYSYEALQQEAREFIQEE